MGSTFAFIFTAYITSFILMVAFTLPQAEYETADPQPLPSLREYAAGSAEVFGVDKEKFIKLVQCESEWKEDALGDHGASTGILQFKKSTFELFSEKYGLENTDINNPYHQIDLAAQMIKDGYGFHWKNCMKKIGWKNYGWMGD